VPVAVSRKNLPEGPKSPGGVGPRFAHALVPGEHRGEPFAVGLRESQQGRGELRQRVALVGPFALRAPVGVGGAGVCGLGFAGTSTGTSDRRRRRKSLQAFTCNVGPVARQAGGHRFEPRSAHLM